MIHDRLAAAVTATLFLIALPATAQTDARPILVVADAACAHYAADVAGFATCEGDRVVKPEANADTQTVTVRGSRLTAGANGRAAAPWHRSRGSAAAAPRR